MKRIIIELIEDEKSGGYTIISDDIHNGSVIAQGDTVLEAINNFADALHDIEEYLKPE